MTSNPTFFLQNPGGRIGGWLIALCCVVMTGVAPAEAARVNGTLVAYEGAAPQRGRYLHFQNEASGDCYMAATSADGSFGAQLPPGIYDLRAEHGAILAHGIVVGANDFALGRVSELAPYAPARIWQYQAIAPSQLTSPAPSTANIMTLDKIVLPPSTRVAAEPAPMMGTPMPKLTPPEAAPMAAREQHQGSPAGQTSR